MWLDETQAVKVNRVGNILTEKKLFFIQIFKVWCLCLSYISLHLCNILPCTALINLSPLSLTHWTIDTFSTQGLNQRSNTGRQRRAFQISRGCNQAAASHLYHWDRPASYSIYHVFDGGAGHWARLPQSSRGLWQINQSWSLVPLVCFLVVL